ncbi:MAG: tRNA (adenosine(37)-N6)-threonylcarbamoyltransferase complex ATPase subunit type 1 TsaE [bacterium]|nr:tRNA (adenosine(37)-N6)-threonylcarbamoyltransferase complex ATPase subunit type 1 TsaE [bacterium]
MNQTLITSSVEETKKLGKELIQKLLNNQSNVIALYGDLGSGKTTFIQGLAGGLGITKRILSPTFIIVRTYDIPKSSSIFYHIDLYRTNNTLDLKGLGLNEMFNNPNNVVAIEWAEKMGNLLPKDRIDIKFEYVEENKRKIIIENF